MPSIALAIVSRRAPSQSSLAPLARPYLLRYTIDGVKCQNAYTSEDERDSAAAVILHRGSGPVVLAYDREAYSRAAAARGAA